MVYDPLELVKLRNAFYRDSYHKIIVVLFIELIIIVGLTIALLVVIAERPAPQYFAATDSGRIIPLVALNQPNLKDKALLQWASEAVISVYSYNFQNYREIFQENQKYFTQSGWRGFMQAVSSAKNLEIVQEKRLVVSAVLTGAPIITNKYELGGRYTWEVQMPVLVTYQSAADRINQNFIITLEIRRISTLDNVYGVGISKFVAQQA
jgi:intracellular multiplication protein IcmL